MRFVHTKYTFIGCDIAQIKISVEIEIRVKS